MRRKAKPWHRQFFRRMDKMVLCLETSHYYDGYLVYRDKLWKSECNVKRGWDGCWCAYGVAVGVVTYFDEHTVSASTSPLQLSNLIWQQWQPKRGKKINATPVC